MQQLDVDLSQREEEDKIPTEIRPSFPRSVKRNSPTRYTDHHEDADSDCDCDCDDDMYAPPSSSSASSSENGDEEPYVRDTRI